MRRSHIRQSAYNYYSYCNSNFYHFCLIESTKMRVHEQLKIRAFDAICVS